jgi:hypothetical protein
MALREFKDSRGMEWIAWDVPPTRELTHTRSGVERRTTPTPDYRPERRVIRDRRRMQVGAGLERGWVCFQSPEEKRRLAPPPPDWESVETDALEELLGAAEPIARRGVD